MMDPSLVLFAIESAVKLGRKVHEVLVDETVVRPLVLPVGHLYQSVTLTTAKTYFGRPKNAHLITGDGPYGDFGDNGLLLAYQTLLDLDRRLDSAEPNQVEAMRLVTGLGRFEQMKQGFGPKSSAQRIVGTVVHFFRRIGTGLIRGAATAFEQNLDLFLPRPRARHGGSCPARPAKPSPSHAR